MLTHVIVHDINDSQSLPVASPESNSNYLITNIEGLGPVDADIFSSRLGDYDGTFLNAASVGNRNIVLYLKYSPNYATSDTVSDLRRDLYKFFAPKKKVTLEFIFDDRPGLEIEGYVESHNPLIFAKDPTVQISILCLDPYFKEVAAPSPQSNSSGSPLVIDYETNVESGFVVSFMTPAASIDKFTLTVENDFGVKTLECETLHVPLASEITLSSVYRDKYITMKPGSNPVTSILKGVELTNGWPVLQLGENEISLVIDPTVGSNVNNPVFSVLYTTLYEGL